MSEVDNYHIPANYYCNTILPSTTYGRVTLGANGVPNKLFIAFMFSDHDVDVLFLKDVGLIPNNMMAVSADNKCPGASTQVLKTVTDGVV
jgi:hypothetical protein